MKSSQKFAATLLAVAGGAAILLAPASAQNYPAYPPPPPYGSPYHFGPHNHNQASVTRRLRDQQRMINAGIRNGTLTPHQQALLEARENYVRQQQAMFRAQHGGKITPEERRKLEAVLNHDSGAIKHESRY